MMSELSCADDLGTPQLIPIATQLLELRLILSLR